MDLLSPNDILTHQVLVAEFSKKNIEVFFRRLDLIHPLVSGNKFYKLKYNIREAQRQGKEGLLTFGGAYSNHIHAVAAAAYLINLKSIGFIRGEESSSSNPTLSFAEDKGMVLKFLDRSSYRGKNDPKFLQKIEAEYPEYYIVPEGGTNNIAIKGASEILQKEDRGFTHILVPIGTGGTFSGMLQCLNIDQELIGISVLKGAFINESINSILANHQIQTKGSFKIFDQFHFGGYAKFDMKLIEFIKEFHKQTGILLDPIYTGKMAYALFELAKERYFPSGSKILCIHTGGLQGIKGFNNRFGYSLPEEV